jgi:2-polyprenyl-3-methyl-5-hydroxy-6-metoxy-1,4-benzoquinol methylase
MRILEEISQYLPLSGRILDIGCGFGLFTLYYALLSPSLRFVSIDMSQPRIDTARSASMLLDLPSQVSFENRTAESLVTQPLFCDAAYMLDRMHHLPRMWHKPLMTSIFHHLSVGEILIIKDIATLPRWKMAFTWILDMLMNPQHPPS